MTSPRRRSLTAALATTAALALAVPAATSATGPAILGNAAFATHGHGWGFPHPRTVDNGGDPSGYVSQVRWRHWGAASSYAYGRNAIFMPGGGYYAQLATIELRAYDLGHCPGSQRLAYRRLKARIPSHPGGKLGRWFSWSGAKTICSAPY